MNKPVKYLSVKDILVNARMLILDPKKWTQGAFARKADGTITHPFNEAAICFCTVGALYKFGGETVEYDHAYSALNYAMLKNNGGIYNSIMEMNDKVSHDQVIAAFDAAILTFD